MSTACAKLPAIFEGQKKCNVNCDLPINKKKEKITMGRLMSETTTKLWHNIISYFSGALEGGLNFILTEVTFLQQNNESITTTFIIQHT